jgi:nucleoside-diphosphate-sugar epimerase
MTRILLAGGCGFLGSHIAEELVRRDYEVVIVDNLSSGRQENLAGLTGRVRLVQEDIVRLSLRERFDVVLNLASRASRAEWERFPVEVCLANSLGHDNLLRIALQSGSRYILASTSEVYGDPEVIPTPEGYVGRIDPTRSRAPYDESKRFAETLLLAYVRERQLDGTIARIFNSYGPRMRGDDLYGRVVDRFLRQALRGEPITVYGNGSQTRAFTYVDDTVQGLLTLISSGKSGEVYNVGSDVETKILDLAQTVRRMTGSTSELTFRPLPQDDPKRRAPDVSKIRSLGWSPVVDLETGLARTIEAIRT